MSRTFYILLFFLSCIKGQAQVERTFIQEKWIDQKDSLKLHYNNKTIETPEFELPILLALSFYPELKDTPIKFVYKSMKAAMMASPKWNFLLRKKKQREYIVYISSNPKRRKEILPIHYPLNCQIGVLGHELAHIHYFSTKSKASIIRFGLGQLSDKFQQRTEQETDLITINHGLGWQLYDQTVFLCEKGSPAYIKMKSRIYLTAEKILKLIKERTDIYGIE